MDEQQEETSGRLQPAGRGSLAGDASAARAPARPRRIVRADEWDSAETNQAIAEDFDRLT
ncbi:hypothetical protein ACIBG5_39080 [Kribbella sp. NPDC050241]|uniref:hypothetical protein n=1 Tax=Kribbella sp. NPDC050241 TaxID=3364115 RepID=UPI0037A4A97F